MQTPWLAASLLGVITGVCGGLVRDVLVNEVPLIMRPGTLYATASWVGALALIGLLRLGAGEVTAALVGGGLVLVLRLAAIRYRLSLPTFRSR
ncbi:trimeric intracellular cation channel family protein, partial [bacterium]|nr:trimeric intracellular cation channel family protein [bacterium]